MNIFGQNNLSEPASNSQKIGLILYLVLSLISIWATSESLQMTFDINPVIAYLTAGAVIACIGAMLSIIKASVQNKNLVALILAFIAFVFLWLIVLTTNTHNFYLKGSLKAIQENELKTLKIEFGSLNTTASSIVDKNNVDFVSKVSNLISNYKLEVVNPASPGHGTVAEDLKLQVEKSMPGSSFHLPPGDWYSTDKKKRALSELMGARMIDVMNERVNNTNQLKSELDKITSDKSISQATKEIDGALKNIFDATTDDNRKVISNTTTTFNGIREQILKKFSTVYGDVNLSIAPNIPQTPKSIDLEHISNSYKYLKTSGNLFNSEIVFAFMIAFFLDLGAIIIFYFMVLKNED